SKSTNIHFSEQRRPQRPTLLPYTTLFRSVEKLNKEQGAGLTVPAIVRPLADDTLRLKHQLTENMDRENQSPMDQAVAIDKLLKRSEEHTSELQSRFDLVCRLLLEKKKRDV